MHHIAYWVDDLEAESRHLVDNGFIVELTQPPGDLIRGYGYLRSSGGLRIELEKRARKGPIAKWFATGEARPGRARPRSQRVMSYDN